MSATHCPIDEAAAAAWSSEWEARYGHRWTLSGISKGTALYSPREPFQISFAPLPEGSRETILALERQINDGQQISAVPGKETT